MIESFYMPVKVIGGAGCVLRNAAALKLGKKAMIVTGRYSSKRNGSLDDVTEALKQNGQDCIVFDRIMSDPGFSCVYDGAKFAKDNGVDMIVAVGGGSAMDAAKVIALLARQDIAKEDLLSGDYDSDRLPIACVPTTSGTGSEVTQYSILTDDQAQTKKTVAAPFLFPDVSMLDPGYTAQLGRDITVNTAADALCHLTESYLSVRGTYISKALSLSGISMIAGVFGHLADRCLTPDDRQTLMTAADIGGIVIAQTGTTAVHAMGYPLTYFGGIPHGLANGLLLASFLSFAAGKLPDHTADLLCAMNIGSADELGSVLGGLLRTDIVFTPSQIEKYTESAAACANTRNSLAEPSPAEIAQIYRESLRVTEDGE